MGGGGIEVNRIPGLETVPWTPNLKLLNSPFKYIMHLIVYLFINLPLNVHLLEFVLEKPAIIQ